MTTALQTYQESKGDTHARAAEILPGLEAFEVTTADQAIYIGDVRKELSRLIKEVETERQEIANPQHKAWKATNAFFKRFSAPLVKAKGVADRKLLTWERSEMDRKAEAQRIADKAAAEAFEARAQGDETKATTGLEIAQAAVIEAAAPVAQAKGLSKRDRWIASVTDLGALIKAAAADPALVDYLIPDQTRLNAMAKAAQVEGPARGIPGVEFVNDFYMSE